MSEYPELFAALAKPFVGTEVKTRRQGNFQVSYITARIAMNRLDEVLGPENWWDEYVAQDESVLCKLTIRLPDGRTVTKCDAGGHAGMPDTGDDEKSGYSDAFKRAAVKFGVGRHLYGDGIPKYDAATIPMNRRAQAEPGCRHDGRNHHRETTRTTDHTSRTPQATHHRDAAFGSAASGAKTDPKPNSPLDAGDGVAGDGPRYTMRAAASLTQADLNHAKAEWNRWMREVNDAIAKELGDAIAAKDAAKLSVNEFRFTNHFYGQAVEKGVMEPAHSHGDRSRLVALMTRSDTFPLHLRRYRERLVDDARKWLASRESRLHLEQRDYE